MVSPIFTFCCCWIRQQGSIMDVCLTSVLDLSQDAPTGTFYVCVDVVHYCTTTTPRRMKEHQPVQPSASEVAEKRVIWRAGWTGWLTCCVLLSGCLLEVLLFDNKQYLVPRITQHNTTQHNTTQHNTTQHNTTQHNTTVQKSVCQCF